jgi:hypothetical protein
MMYLGTAASRPRMKIMILERFGAICMCIVMPSYSSIYTLSDGIEGWHLLKWRGIAAHGIGYYVPVDGIGAEATIWYISEIL